MGIDNSDKRLNKEQLQAIKHKKGPLLIIAGAGTGKTTVITERIKYLISKELAKPSEILALTFTEKASREMEERVDVAMPYGYTQMWISTFHSFCDRVLRDSALNIGLDPRFKLMTEAETIQFIRKYLFDFDLDYFRPLGNPTKFISGMLRHFSRLQDEDVSPSDYIRWVQNQKSKVKGQKDKSKLKIDKTELEKWMELAKAYKKYEELKVKEGVMDFGDLIVKTLSLFRQRPNILRQYQKQFKYILVDEFQDTNYAQNELAILLAGKGKGASDPGGPQARRANITVTGDDDQCLPPTARISTPTGNKIIKDIKVGNRVITAVGKGHTSISKVTKIFKQNKRRRLLTFETESGKKLTVTDNHKMFCFIPAHYELRDWHFVYLMQKKDVGWRIGVTNNLPQRLRLERRSDLIIGIGSYKTDEEARYYEAFYSAKYGIPTIPFSARPQQAISGDLLDKLFRKIDTESNVKKLAADLKIELDSPQFLVDAVTRGASRRIKINFEMCARNYRSKTHKDGFVGNPTVLHMVTLETSNGEVLKKLKTAGFSLRKARKGERIRRNFVDISQAWRFAEKLQKITGGIIDKRFKVGRFNYQHLPARIVPASHVFPGMYLPVLKGKQIHYEKVVSRSEKEELIKTYDLEIERTHNFIADGIVVHNSIYRFRGAAVSNIIQFRKTYPKAKIVVLTKNYRSNQEILDKAYQLVQHNNPDRLEAVEKIDKKLVAQQRKKQGEIAFIHKDRVENEAEAVARKVKEIVAKGLDYKDIAILVRANNHAEPFGRAFSRHGIPYQFLGPGRLFRQAEVIDLISYLKVLYDYDDSVALYRVLSLDFFGIPSRDLIKISNYARRLNLTLFEACDPPSSRSGGTSEGQGKLTFVSSETREKIYKLMRIINKHLDLVKKETAGQLLYYFLQDTGLLQKLLSPDTPDAEKRAANISKFFDKLKTYEVDHEDATVTAVVDWIELSSELGESPRATDFDWMDVNAVNILTVHSAKGLEFPAVFLVNLVSQRFPTSERREQIPIPEDLIKELLPQGDYHLQEERRLFYVGMTRAMGQLYFTAADYYGEGKREKHLSPFIFEALGDEATAAESSVAEAMEDKQLSFLDYEPSKDQPQVVGHQPLHIDYLSYSQIETFKTCPLHYRLRYILKLPTFPSASQSFGTSIHAALKSFYLKVKDGRRPAEKLILSCLDEVWIKDGYTSKFHEKKFYEKGKLYLAGFLKEGFEPKNLPTLLEEQFTVPLKSGGKVQKPLRIGGKIDRVDVLKDGGIEIIDYKTGATIPSQNEVDKNIQLSFYALAGTKIPEGPFNRKPQKVKLSLYFLDTQEKLSTTRTSDDLKKAVEEIYQVRDEIEKSEFRCSGHMFCENCEYALMCRVERPV